MLLVAVSTMDIRRLQYYVDIVDIFPGSVVDCLVVETLEARVSRLEATVAQLEESLVRDYGLVKRCREPRLEHGVAACNYQGEPQNTH